MAPSVEKKKLKTTCMYSTETTFVFSFLVYAKSVEGIFPRVLSHSFVCGRTHVTTIDSSDGIFKHLILMNKINLNEKAGKQRLSGKR